MYHRGNKRTQMFNHFKNRDQDEYYGNGDVDLQKGAFDIRVRFSPVCGANFRFTYRYEFYDPNPDSEASDDFEPNTQKCWNHQGNKGYSAPYYASDCTKTMLNRDMRAMELSKETGINQVNN
jgi:hypothetical protein